MPEHIDPLQDWLRQARRVAPPHEVDMAIADMAMRHDRPGIKHRWPLRLIVAATAAIIGILLVRSFPSAQAPSVGTTSQSALMPFHILDVLQLSSEHPYLITGFPATGDIMLVDTLDGSHGVRGCFTADHALLLLRPNSNTECSVHEMVTYSKQNIHAAVQTLGSILPHHAPSATEKNLLLYLANTGDQTALELLTQVNLRYPESMGSQIENDHAISGMDLVHLKTLISHAQPNAGAYRSQSIRALGQVQSPLARQALRQLASSPQDPLLPTLLEVLIAQRDSLALPLLESLLEQPTPPHQSELQSARDALLHSCVTREN